MTTTTPKPKDTTMKNEVKVIAADETHWSTKLTAECTDYSYESASMQAYKRLYQNAKAKHFLAAHCVAAMNEIMRFETDGCSVDEWEDCKKTVEAAIACLTATGLGDTVQYRRVVKQAFEHFSLCD